MGPFKKIINKKRAPTWDSLTITIIFRWNIICKSSVNFQVKNGENFHLNISYKIPLGLHYVIHHSFDYIGLFITCTIQNNKHSFNKKLRGFFYRRGTDFSEKRKYAIVRLTKYTWKACGICFQQLRSKIILISSIFLYPTPFNGKPVALD